MIVIGIDCNLPSQTSLLEKSPRFVVTSDSSKMCARGPDNLSELAGADSWIPRVVKPMLHSIVFISVWAACDRE